MGGRSRAAAAALANAGFKEAYSMEGGIRGWKGARAEGTPESKMAYFTPATRPEEFIALAWTLEQGSRTFYSEMANTVNDPMAKGVFRELMVAEERHQLSLKELYRKMFGSGSDSTFPASVFPPSQTGEMMEGGIQVDEALKWTEGKGLSDILEFSITLEVNSYDLYTLMERKAGDPGARMLFSLLSDEEKLHLNRLTALFEKGLG
jgi:rubrerythrin